MLRISGPNLDLNDPRVNFMYCVFKKFLTGLWIAFQNVIWVSHVIQIFNIYIHSILLLKSTLKWKEVPIIKILNLFLITMILMNFKIFIKLVLGRTDRSSIPSVFIKLTFINSKISATLKYEIIIKLFIYLLYSISLHFTGFYLLFFLFVFSFNVYLITPFFPKINKQKKITNKVNKINYLLKLKFFTLNIIRSDNAQIKLTKCLSTR